LGAQKYPLIFKGYFVVTPVGNDQP